MDLLEFSHVTADLPESRHVSAHCPNPLLDPLLMSVRTAGDPRASVQAIPEVVPLSSVLPVMAVALLSVWAAHCTTGVSSGHKSAPETLSAHECASKSSYELLEVPTDTVDSSEVLLVTAQPPGPSACSIEPPPSPATAIGVIPDSLSCPVPAMKPIYESSFLFSHGYGNCS